MRWNIIQPSETMAEPAINAAGHLAVDEDKLYAVETGTPIEQWQNDARDANSNPSHDEELDLARLQQVVSALNLISIENNHLPATMNGTNTGRSVEASTVRTQDRSGESESGDDETSFLQVQIPSTSTGPTVFAYERALRNRIKYPKLSKGGDYDTRSYTPTFIHGCLMFPGSLANVMGKVFVPIHVVISR
jgi:hypothetical protein